MSYLDKCLRNLERRKRESIRNLAENCKSESTRDFTIRDILINYESARNWIKLIYSNGKFNGEIDLYDLERYTEEDNVIGYYSKHLMYHLTQMLLLGKRH
jgi:hypothetical protein